MSKVICRFCPNYCSLDEGQLGKCFAKRAIKGRIVLEPLIVSSMHVDPIEKKPIFHFSPNTSVLTVGGVGCSLSCKMCQNHEISMSGPDKNMSCYSESEIIDIAKSYHVDGIFFSYNEPTLYYDYLIILANLAHKEGLFFGIKTNAYFDTSLWKNLCHCCDVMNIDLKGVEQDYIEICGCNNFDTIIRNINYALKLQKDRTTLKDVEISIPVYSEIESYNNWIDRVLEPIDYEKETPIHLLKVFPSHEFIDKKSTSEDALFKLREYLMSKGLFYIYLSNIFSRKGIARNTYDPITKKVIVCREKYSSH